MIKDFISSLQKIIRNKITNQWPEMRNQPRTVQEAFDLVIEIETQIQITESFKIDLSNDFPLVDINEISTEESSRDELVINEMFKGKKWEIIVITEKHHTIIIIIALNLGTTPSNRILNLQGNRSKRREIPRSH